MSSVSLARLLSVSLQAVEVAGGAIRTVLNSAALGTKFKGEKDPVTDADIRSQKVITGTLRSYWPSLCVIGEEDTAAGENSVHSVSDMVSATQVPDHLRELDNSEVVVWVDPLDGTLEYIERNLHAVTVLIGVAYRGTPIAGVIHQPFVGERGRTLWGVVGSGVFGVGDALALPSYVPTQGAVVSQMGVRGPVVVTTRTHGSAIIERSLEMVLPSTVIRIGGAGYKVLMLLDKQADVYVMASRGTKKWDTCAPEALLRAAGGYLTDLHGTPYQYHRSVSVDNDAGVLAGMSGLEIYAQSLRELPSKI